MGIRFVARFAAQASLAEECSFSTARLLRVALRKPQRNDVFTAIQDAKLSPEEFEFEWDAGVDKSSFRHIPSGASFVVRGVAGDYSSWYSAGDEPVEERKALSWYGLTQQVGFWLAAVRRDIETPDLWAQLQCERALLAAVSDEAIENTPFTPAEREEIAGQLRELKDYLSRAHSLSAAQVRLLDERLDYLVDAAGRVGRKDWFLMAAGVMFSYVLAAALPPDSATHILGTLLTSIGHILWGGPLRLPGS
jgi:hypothetical protein